MGANSKIKWTNHSFNPWVGCSKVSDGCKFCCAEALMDKLIGKAQWGPQGTRVRTSEADWLLPFKWNKAAQKSGQRARVFCASQADVFEDRPELVKWRADMFAVINNTPWLDWMLLTKRPENVNRMVADYAGDCEWLSWAGTTPRYNLWIGTSIEDQATANKRVPELLKIPARVRFLSAEPLLGPINLYDVLSPAQDMSVDWVIVGGESGPDARPMHPQWASDLRDFCKAEGIAFNFKSAVLYMPAAPVFAVRQPEAAPVQREQRKDDQIHEVVFDGYTIRKRHVLDGDTAPNIVATATRSRREL